MPLQCIVTDLSGVTQGEVRLASSRKVGLQHIGVGSAGFVVPITSPLASTLLDTDTLVKVYYIDPSTFTKTLVFNGPTVSAEESADGTSNTIAVTCADPLWRLSRRVVPGSMTKTGISRGPDDLGAIARSLLDDVNAVSFTGVSKGSLTNSISGVYKVPPLKNAAEALAELHAGVGSFEFILRPTEPTNVGGSGGWPQLATLDIAPVIGAARPDAVFEYGTTRANIGSYSRQIDRSQLLTRGIVSVEGWPTGTTKDLVIHDDPTASATRGLFDDVIPDGGITDDALRASLVDFHLAIRKQPRQQITFRPAVGASPHPFTDYNLGDSVRARAVLGGTVRFDTTVRIWGISVETDQNGTESVELTLVMP